MKKGFLVYAILISVFACLTILVINLGNGLRPEGEIAYTTDSLAQNNAANINEHSLLSPQNISNQFLQNFNSSLGIFLLQLIIILLVSKVFGLLLVKLGQPSVVGEIIAGIVLGPSVVGLIFPDFFGFLFPPSSHLSLQFLSQIGLTFFMFIVGMDLDIEKISHKTYNAVIISHASIVIPFFLGVSVSYFLYGSFAPPTVSFIAFSLFMGIAMSITAFPVLARIVQERGLSKTPLGVMVITCAATDDVTAWCILAFVIALVKAGSISSALLTLLLALCFVLIMLFLIRPRMKIIAEKYIVDNTLKKAGVTIIFFMLLLSAYISEVIGIHVLFGAFLAGVIMPRDLKFKHLLTEKIEDISVLLLLPIFFVYTGLRTHIGLLNESSLWGVFSLVLLVAVAGKFGGSAIASKMVGHSWKDSFSIGAFMNTRGLMELIVLNIGYDLGILSPEIFAIMVLMAITTTFMTGPLLDIIEYLNRKKTSG